VRTFIVRLQEDAGGSGRTASAIPRLRGTVHEVATGLRATFRNDQELLTALTAAAGTDPTSPPWSAADRTSGGPSSDKPDPIFEEK